VKTIPHVTFGEAIRWHPIKRSVHRTCTVYEGQGRIRHIDIYISEEALMDTLRLAKADPIDLMKAAGRLWNKHIYPIVKRRIWAREVSPDGTLMITSMEIAG
jgi:hypothetical protein